MKRPVVLFLSLAALILLAAPAYNLWLDWTQGSPASADRLDAGSEHSLPWWSRERLYRLDVLLPWMGRLAYPFGISISPKQVVIGREDWLFLGDQYEQIISRKRRPASAEDATTIERTLSTAETWQDWLQARGVALYRIQLVPDKASVYPEYLPQWARPIPGHDTDVLRMRGERSPIYRDQRAALLAAKTELDAPLFFRTDSHWSGAGAWVGYRDLAQALTPTAVGEHLRWLTPDQVRLNLLENQPGLDLAHFLWLGQVLTDVDTQVQIDIGRPIVIEQMDFVTGERTQLSDNPRLGAPRSPLLVRSPNALNEMRVLWLRDSFGTAMAPMMSATFTETLQLHYGLAAPELFAELVREFAPELVIVTTIERAALSHWFQQPPPAS